MPKYTDAPESVAPLRNGKPDLYNYMPTRMVSKLEAEEREWTFFYIGDVCRHGHRAPRYVSAPRTCVDCHREDNKRQTIGAKGVAEYSKPSRPYTERVPKTPQGIAVQPRPIEPDALEKRFLVEYAKTASFDLAADNLGYEPAVFKGRLSYSAVFRSAVEKLESDNGLVRTPSILESYEWTDDRRKTLLRVYIDTGDIAVARASVGVSNFHLLKELDENPEFQADYDKAEEMANKVLDEIGVSQARRGDNKLLTRLLSNVSAARFGESSKVKVDLNVAESRTDEQLRSDIVREILKGRDRSVIDAICVPVEPQRAIAAPRKDPSQESPRPMQPNSDLL